MTVLRALGSSMFPFVPSGSRLELARLSFDSSPGSSRDLQVRVGEIIAYVGRNGIVAHRVIGVNVDQAAYELRGDAQERSEIVEHAALAYRVTRVSYGAVSYATSGWLGRALAHLALRRGRSFRWLRAAGLLLARH